MTSGQGENQTGGPYGPPQGWNAPPSPEAYGQQYPGYAPAPLGARRATGRRSRWSGRPRSVPVSARSWPACSSG